MYHSRIISYSSYLGYKVKWDKENNFSFSNFKLNNNQDSGATTATCVEYTLSKSNDSIILYLESYFYPGLSVVNEKYKLSQELFNHEKTHFDITELFARKFRKFYIDSFYTLICRGRFNEKVYYANFLQITSIDLAREQERYDTETEHGLNSIQQSFWNNKIKGELERYKEYNSILIRMKIANKSL